MRCLERGATQLVRVANLGDLKESLSTLQIFVQAHTSPCAGGGLKWAERLRLLIGHDMGGGRKILGCFHHVLCHQTTLL